MKSKLFNLVLLAVIVTAIMSCSSPHGIGAKYHIGDPKNPCVVTYLETKDSTLTGYETTTGYFVMPTGLFKLGDTIDFTNVAVANRLLASFYSNTANKKVKSNSGGDTTISVNISHLRITPGLIIGIDKDTVSVLYDRNLILGK